MAKSAAPLRLYVLPLLLVCVAGPLTLYAVQQSLLRLGQPFPGFLLMENRVIPTVSGSDWPPRRTELFHAQVIAVDGALVSTSTEVHEYVRQRPVGTLVTYRLHKDGRNFEERLASRAFRVYDYLEVYGILLLIAALNLVLGAIVGFLQPARRESQAYVFLSLTGCLFAATPVFLHLPGFVWLTRLYLGAESFFPASFLLFAFCFPVDRLAQSATGRRRRTLWLALPLAMATLLTIVKLFGFAANPPDLRGFYASYVYIALSFVAFLGSLLHALRREHDTRTQLRIRALLPSVALGSVLAVFAFLDNALSGGTFPLQLGLLLVPFFYASVAYSIVAHDLFGIDRFVRWTFVYATLSVVVYGAYSALASGLPGLAATLGMTGDVVLGIGFVVLAILLDPLRRLVQRLVDRAYFRTPWNYRATIGRVSHEMTGWRSVEHIAEELTRVLTAEMQLESVTVLLFSNARPWSRRADGPLQRLDPSESLSTLQGLGMPPGEVVVVGSVAGLQERLAPLVAELVVPLTFAGRSTGALLLGPTRSRRALHADDLELLRTLAAQAAIALENAHSYEALEEHNRSLDETVRQRTAQLMQSEQLASLGQLVAGVAHELNNPVGAVYNSVENLRLTLAEIESKVRGVTPDGDVGAILEESHDLLAICSEGSERIRGIVRDLLIFARADRGERVPIDIREGLESTVRLLADRCDRAAVQVVCDFSAVPPVAANPAQLNQVWMNLLTNALDATSGSTAPRKEVRILVRPSPGIDAQPSGIEVVVADDGSGMAPEVQARIFEPFFTTKEIGKGTGLGMSISYGIVRDHGGRITVDSAPGRGTTMRVWLPAFDS